MTNSFFFFQIPSDENYSRKTATRKENKLQSPSRLIGIGSRWQADPSPLRWETWSRWQADRCDDVTVNVSSTVIRTRTQSAGWNDQSPLEPSCGPANDIVGQHTYWSQLMYGGIYWPFFSLISVAEGPNFLPPLFEPGRYLCIRASDSSTQVNAHHRLVSRLISVLFFFFKNKTIRRRQRLTRFHHLLVRLYVDQYLEVGRGGDLKPT